MPLAEKKLNTVARLAMGTAMISVLAGCDGRFGRAFDTLVAPITGSEQTVATTPVPVYGNEYVTPGVPTYVEQSQAANVQTFESVYGPPVVDTASGTYVTDQSYTVPSFNDGTVDVTPIAAPQVATYTQRVQQAQPIFGGVPVDGGAAAYIDPVPSSYAVATVPAAVVPSSTLPAIDGSYSSGEQLLGLDTTVVGGMVETGPTAFDAGPAIDTYDTTTILDSGFDALPAEQAFPAIVAPAAVPAPSYDLPSGDAVQVISNAEAVATFGGETLPAPLPPVESSVFDSPAGLSVPSDQGGQFQVLPQSRLEAPAPAAQDTGTVEAMWNDLTTSSVDTSATMAPVGRGADQRAAVQTSPAPLPKAIMPASKVAVVDNGPRTAPTPRQRPARSYATLTAAPLPQPRPAYNKPVAMATTAGNYVSIGALPSIDTAALAAPKMPVDAMLPASSTEGNAMAPRDAAPKAAPAPVEMAKLSEPASSGVKAPAAASGMSELSGTSWRLIAVDTTPVSANAELHFDGRSGFAGGQGPCNSYGGEFRNTGKGSFAMSDIFTTDVACPSSAVEKQYIGALEKARSYKISRGFSDLTLLDESGATVATFRAF